MADLFAPVTRTVKTVGLGLDISAMSPVMLAFDMRVSEQQYTSS